jgi:triacylglycerol lipase
LTDYDPLAAVDPDLRSTLAVMPDLDQLSQTTLPAIRTMLQGETVTLGATGTVTVSRVAIPSMNGAAAVSALLYQPLKTSGDPIPALLNIHGGGFVAGSAQREHAAMCILASELGCVVLSPDYRLAPEYPFPAALEDCRASLGWLHREAAALNIDDQRIAARGVSAGGCLALGLALLTRDDNVPSVCFLSLVYPMLDDRTGPHMVAGKYVWTANANRFAWDSYLGGQNRASPSLYAVPGRATDFANLPPIFLAVGGIDLFVGETLSLATRLVDAGVPTELHIYPGAYHGFNLVENSRATKAFTRDSSAAFKRALSLR